jgi:hypothetical protein
MAPRRTFAGGVAGILGLALVCPLVAGHAAETRTSINVSVVVTNNCTVSLAPKANGSGISSHCAWPQPMTVYAVPEAGFPPAKSVGATQGIRYLAVEY